MHSTIVVLLYTLAWPYPPLQWGGSAFIRSFVRSFNPAMHSAAATPAWLEVIEVERPLLGGRSEAELRVVKRGMPEHVSPSSLL